MHTLERKEIAHAIAAAEKMNNSGRDFAFAKPSTTKSRNLPLLEEEEEEEAADDEENQLGRSASRSSNKRKSRRILSPTEDDEGSDGLGLTSPKGNVSFLQWYVAGQEHISTGRDRYSARGRAGTRDNHNATNAAVASRHHKARLSGPSLYDQYTGDVDPLATPLATDGARREVSPIISPEARNRSTSRDHKAAVGGAGAALRFDNVPISEKRSGSDGKWKLFDVASHSQSSTKSVHNVIAPAPPRARPRSATPSIGIMTLKNTNYDSHDTPVYPYTNSSLDLDLPRQENQSIQLVSRPLLLASFETSANKITDISTTSHFRSNTNHAHFSPQHDSSPARNRKNYISY